MNHSVYTEQQLIEIISDIDVNGPVNRLAHYKINHGFYFYWRRKLREKILEYRNLKVDSNIQIDELLAESQRLKILLAESMLKNQVLRYV
ncbi:hypothetical protein [Comamonas suwonensis]|uniref:hypothetical protein n=1 Tax=Comamonas suwonensis TaxID=2606214 RepID=UPI00145D26C0|nr:hypothetical protein [Comamonas suwonensis]MBI1624777.1 hypothetical protein [Comamonas suwonensis]